MGAIEGHTRFPLPEAVALCQVHVRCIHLVVEVVRWLGRAYSSIMSSPHGGFIQTFRLPHRRLRRVQVVGLSFGGSIDLSSSDACAATYVFSRASLWRDRHGLHFACTSMSGAWPGSERAP